MLKFLRTRQEDIINSNLKGEVHFDNIKLQKSYEQLVLAAKKASIEDRERLVKKESGD